MILFASGGFEVDAGNYSVLIDDMVRLDWREARDLRDSLTEWLQLIGRDE